MSCSPHDLRDFFLKELSAHESRAVETHLRGCPGCQEELERYQITEAALMTMGDEEIPRRVAFVPAPALERPARRNWWGAFWASGARLGFASAAMLSASLVFFALHRPETAPAPLPGIAQAPQTQSASLSQQEVDRQIRAAVAAALQETEVRWEGRMQTALTASLERERQENYRLKLAEEANRHLERSSGALLAASYRTPSAVVGEQR